MFSFVSFSYHRVEFHWSATERGDCRLCLTFKCFAHSRPSSSWRLGNADGCKCLWRWLAGSLCMIRSTTNVAMCIRLWYEVLSSRLEQHQLCLYIALHNALRLLAWRMTCFVWSYTGTQSWETRAQVVSMHPAIILWQDMSGYMQSKSLHVAFIPPPVVEACCMCR